MERCLERGYTRSLQNAAAEPYDAWLTSDSAPDRRPHALVPALFVVLLF